LKRFRSSHGLSYKLLQHVTFPTTLDVQDFMAGTAKEAAGKEVIALGERSSPADGSSFGSLSRTESQYRLFAVVNHIGEMCAGHYTAYVKRGSAWFGCNDDHVYSISEQEVVSSVHAYLLFYSRADVSAGDIGLRQLFPAPRPDTAPADVKEVRRKALGRGSQDRPTREGGLFDWFSSRAPALETLISRLAQHPPGELPTDAQDIFSKLQKGLTAMKGDREAIAKLEPKAALLHFLAALHRREGSPQSRQIRGMVSDLREVEAWREVMEADGDVLAELQEIFPEGVVVAGGRSTGTPSEIHSSGGESLTEPLGAGRSGMKCSRGHPIAKQKRCARWHQHWLREISCSCCGARIPRSEPRWRCRHRCDYNVCTGCYARAPSPATSETAATPG